MLRRLFTFISVLSLLLCITAGVMGARSGWHWETLHVRTGGWFWKVTSMNGTLGIEHYSGWPNPPNYHVHTTDPVRARDLSTDLTPMIGIRNIGGAGRTEWRRAEFAGARGTVCVMLRADGSVDWDSPALPAGEAVRNGTARFSALFAFWAIGVPYWSVVALFALLPLASTATAIVRRVRIGRRQSRGLCLVCGYDLRASKEICPECGTPVPAKAVATGQHM